MSLFSHITVGSSDLSRSGRFYDALFEPLGLVRRIVAVDGGPEALCWHHPSFDLPRFYVYLPFDGERCSHGNGSMTAFLAPSRDAVAAAHAAGLANGGTDEGEPGERPQYAADYYGAYLRDPDGNKLHLVHRRLG